MSALGRKRTFADISYQLKLAAHCAQMFGDEPECRAEGSEANETTLILRRNLPNVLEE